MISVYVYIISDSKLAKFIFVSSLDLILLYIISDSKLAKFILATSLGLIILKEYLLFKTSEVHPCNYARFESFMYYVYIIYHSKLAKFILVSSLGLIRLYIIYYSKLAKFIQGTSLGLIMLKEYLLFKTSEVHPCNFARIDSLLYICRQYFISLII